MIVAATDGSPREIARLMGVSGVRRGVVVNWVNQYSSDPEWREDTMLAIQYAERERRASHQPPRVRKCRGSPLRH